MVGAVGLVAYVVAKPRFHGPGAWRLPLVPPGASTTTYHLLETVPLLALLAGVVAFDRTRPGPRGPGERAGFAVTLGGVHGSILAHFGEHLLPAAPVPGFPDANAYVYLYFGCWLLAGAGLGLYGLGVLASGDAPVTAAVIAAVLPLGVLAGAAVVVLGVDNFGDGLKLPFALAAAVAAYRAWTASEADVPATGTRQRSD